MSNKNTIIIQKMRKYCDDAVKYSVGLAYEEFTQNELYLTFSVFALSQLGELATKADSSLCERFPQIPWQAMRGIRNRIVHNYDGVQFHILWAVLTENIPELQKQLKDALEALNTEDDLEN